MNLDGKVKIELSWDGGATFEMLFGDAVNTGSSEWILSPPSISQAVSEAGYVMTWLLAF